MDTPFERFGVHVTPGLVIVRAKGFRNVVTPGENFYGVPYEKLVEMGTGSYGARELLELGQQIAASANPERERVG